PEESNSTSQELALILQMMALLRTQIQKRYYYKPTNNNLRITSAPTIQNKRLNYLPQNEVVRQDGIRNYPSGKVGCESLRNRSMQPIKDDSQDV
ncbi:hypothetical protein Tco_0288241, partial [Tanacetum coccineum]